MVDRLWRAGIRLLLWLVALLLLVVSLIQDLPLGMSTRAGLLTILLIGLALYWLFIDLGYRPLLLFQLVLFSTALALIGAKVFLVAIGIHRLSILRRTAFWLVFLGAICGGANVLITFLNLFRPSARSSQQ
ncbi:MAG TPA: hypothetical protein VH879_06085 [Gemmatimonadales bacterium]